MSRHTTPGAAAITQGMTKLLYGVRPVDAPTILQWRRRCWWQRFARVLFRLAGHEGQSGGVVEERVSAEERVLFSNRRSSAAIFDAAETGLSPGFMFGMDSSKLQEKGKIPSPLDARAHYGELIISQDTLRADRLPPRQSRTLKWPVLDASGAPEIDLARWRFSLEGLIGKLVSWNWEEFRALPKVKVFADFHCVTRWSRLGNVWEGVFHSRTGRASRRSVEPSPLRHGVRLRLRVDHKSPAGRFSIRGRTGRPDA